MPAASSSPCAAARTAAASRSPRATALSAAASARLRAAGFEVDYVALRRPDLAEPADGEAGPRVALVAARLGRTRLIDNLEFDAGDAR